MIPVEASDAEETADLPNILLSAPIDKPVDADNCLVAEELADVPNYLVPTPIDNSVVPDNSLVI